MAGTLSLDAVRRGLLAELETILAVDLSPDDARKPLPELGVDSLGLVELFVAVETRFGVKLMELGLARADLETIDAMAAAICRGA